MSNMSASTEKTLKIAEIAARLVQASNSNSSHLEDALINFDKAYFHVKNKLSYDVSK